MSLARHLPALKLAVASAVVLVFYIFISKEVGAKEIVDFLGFKGRVDFLGFKRRVCSDSHLIKLFSFRLFKKVDFSEFLTKLNF